MTYADIFKRHIQKSGLSLSQVCSLLHEKGLKTEKSYLSKLQNGKLPPGGDRLNNALAEVLEIDPIELKAAAYREKIPKEVLDHLNNMAVKEVG
jgi:repressor LexA